MKPIKAGIKGFRQSSASAARSAVRTLGAMIMVSLMSLQGSVFEEGCHS
jgi:hypothetical protein